MDFRVGSSPISRIRRRPLRSSFFALAGIELPRKRALAGIELPRKNDLAGICLAEHVCFLVIFLCEGTDGIIVVKNQKKLLFVNIKRHKIKEKSTDKKICLPDPSIKENHGSEEKIILPVDFL